jgi:hypothetical protein
MEALEAVIVASCPEVHQDKVTEICRVKDFQKAYGRAGDMVDILKGKDWVGKWQAKVVAAAITKAQSMKVNRVKIICIEGGKFCNAEYAHIPLLKEAIEKEWTDNKNSSSLRVNSLWLSFEHFVEDHGSVHDRVPLSGLSLESPLKGSDPSRADAKSKTKKEAEVEKPQSGKSSTLLKADGSSSKLVNTKTMASPVPVGNEMLCEVCSRSFASVAALVQHVEDTDHIFTIHCCNGCNESFSIMDPKKLLPIYRFKQHQETTGHRGSRNSTTSVSALKALDRKKGADEGEWQCGECQKIFRSEIAFNSHQQSTRHKDPTCMICERSFGSKISLEQHLEDTGHISF